MSSPGSGRYTNFTPVATGIDPNSVNNYINRKSLFVDAAAEKFRGFTVQSEVVDIAKSKLEEGAGDLKMFPLGVKLDFSTAPNLTEAQVSRIGDPASIYGPDLRSPGASEDGTVNLTPDSKENLPEAAKGKSLATPTSTVAQSASDLGRQSPHITSGILGASPITSLVMGKSKATLGG